MKNLTICVLGGTGFVGSHLCAELVKRGHQVKVLTRQREPHRHLLVLPSLELIQANIHDEGALKQHFENCDVVINLVGILNEKGRDGSGFHTAHVELARKVITMCSTCKVPRLLHMSALNASPDEKSFYLRTNPCIVFPKRSPESLGHATFHSQGFESQNRHHYGRIVGHR